MSAETVLEAHQGCVYAHLATSIYGNQGTVNTFIQPGSLQNLLLVKPAATIVFRSLLPNVDANYATLALLLAANPTCSLYTRFCTDTNPNAIFPVGAVSANFNTY